MEFNIFIHNNIDESYLIGTYFPFLFWIANGKILIYSLEDLITIIDRTHMKRHFRPV